MDNIGTIGQQVKKEIKKNRRESPFASKRKSSAFDTVVLEESLERSGSRIEQYKSQVIVFCKSGSNPFEGNGFVYVGHDID